jgi:hypothetical protein
MKNTDLSPEAYYQAVSILISNLEEALKNQHIHVSMSHEHLGDTLFSYLSLGGWPRQNEVISLAYFLTSIPNCGIVRGIGRHKNSGQFTLKRKITNV